jgi:hypothetical protein
MRNMSEKIAKQNNPLPLSKNEENVTNEKRMKELNKICGK